LGNQGVQLKDQLLYFYVAQNPVRSSWSSLILLLPRSPPAFPAHVAAGDVAMLLLLLLLVELPTHCLFSPCLSALKRLAATFFADNAVIKIQLQLKVRTQNGQRQTK